MNSSSGSMNERVLRARQSILLLSDYGGDASAAKDYRVLWFEGWQCGASPH